MFHYNLVAAFDNNGVISYPAMLPTVIGVHWSTDIIRVRDYIYVEGSPVNILAYAGHQYLHWRKNNKNVSVSSFTAPYITCIITGYKNKYRTLHGLHDYLKDRAISCLK